MLLVETTGASFLEEGIEGGKVFHEVSMKYHDLDKGTFGAGV